MSLAITQDTKRHDLLEAVGKKGFAVWIL